jgi:hypothetical protein
MSTFFKEVEFPHPESPATPKPHGFVWNAEALSQALMIIEREVGKIIAGTSDLTKYAIDPKSFGFPAMHALKIFVGEPSDKAFEGIPEILGQDLGGRAKKYFTQLLLQCREEAK